MSVPSDKLMEMMKGGAPGADAGDTPAAAGMSDNASPPMSSPMSTPEPKMGSKEAAMVNLSMAMDLIEQALPALGSESSEGQKALQSLKTLTAIIGPKKGKTNELQQSEILQMLQSLPQAGGASPEGKAIAQAPAIPGMSPGGGGTPPGVPPSAPTAAPPSPPQM